MGENVFIVGAARTPIGVLNGSLSALKSHELGSAAITGALISCSVRPDEVSDVIMGQVLVAGQGQNPARQAAVGAQIPFRTPASGVSMVCGSGLRAVLLGCYEVKNGDSGIVVAGGQESMSQAPHCIRMRTGLKFGDAEMKDTMLVDGLVDAFDHVHMGVTAENVAKEYNVSRDAQDVFAFESQMKYRAAEESGHFDAEIVSVSTPGTGKKAAAGTLLVNKDENPRRETTIESLRKLRPVFAQDGTVTAGNASSLNDGAAAVVLMSETEVRKREATPMARVVSSAITGVHPSVMGTGPISAIQAAVEKAGWKLDQVDLFEINEAFAAQSIAVIESLGIDKAKVNVNGGAIAMGHPIGASGCRVLVTLLHTMKRTGKKRGCASLCIGGGMGIAICIEEP